MPGVTTASWRTAEYRRSGVDVEFLSLGDLWLLTRVNEEVRVLLVLGMCEVAGRGKLFRGIGVAFEGISTLLFRGIARA